MIHCHLMLNLLSQNASTHWLKPEGCFFRFLGAEGGLRTGCYHLQRAFCPQVFPKLYASFFLLLLSLIQALFVFFDIHKTYYLLHVCEAKYHFSHQLGQF